MAITLNGTTGITTPDITSDSYTGPLNVDAAAPDNSLVVTSAGKVGIGTSSPSTALHTVGANGDSATTLATSASNAALRFQRVLSSSLSLWQGTVESGTKWYAQVANGPGTSSYDMVINPFGGKVMMGTTGSLAVGYIFHSSGFLQHCRPSGAAQSMTGFYNGGNVVGEIRTSTTATAYLTSSDYRLKEDWQPMTGASERVKALKPVNFAWKLDGSRVDGFLAHEAQEVVPECVSGVKDAVDAEGNPNYQGIDQSKLVPLLTAALQEALTKIDALTARIEALEQA